MRTPSPARSPRGSRIASGRLYGRSRPARSTPHASRVRELVEASLGTNLTVADLATAAGLSVAHFAREFRRATGQTPHAFVMSQRLERARRLLVVGRRPAEVAAATGFADQAHLSRAFRARFGVPPGKFRTTYRSAASFKVARSDVQDGKGDDGEPRG